MARVLIVDSNPDTQRALSGLLKYRTRHTFEMVESCTDGARKAISMAPDLIMINALMFIGSNYAFPRVMQQHNKTAGISFLVHTARDVGELTRKQIEASGVAGMVELPISAEELGLAIEQAVERSAGSRKDKGGIKPVQWQRVEKPADKAKQGAYKGKAVQSVQWQSISPEEAKKTGITKARRASPQPKAAPKQRVAKSQVFRPLSETAKQEKPKSSGFQATSFRQVDEDDVVHNKKPATFEAQTWDDVDPGETVKRRRR